MAHFARRRFEQLAPLSGFTALAAFLAATLGSGVGFPRDASARSEAGPRSQARAQESEVAARISESRLRLAVKQLVALGPRMGGTPSGDAAAAYVAREMTRAGLQTRVLDDTQVRGYWADRWTVSLVGPRERLASAWPYVGSPAIEFERTAALVSVTSLRAAAADTWRSKIVFTPDLTEEDYIAAAASQTPPVAILTSAPHEPGRYVEWARIGEIPAKTPRRVPVFGLSYNDGLRVEAAIGQGRACSVSLAARSRQSAPRTVVATLPGAHRERYYLVTAHGDSDSGGPGADDNASGVAVVLEVARALAEFVRGEGSVRLPFSIRFVVWGAEYTSARDYIRREGASLADCLGVINFDQVGTGAERETIYVEGNDVPWNSALLKAFTSVARAHQGGRDGYWPEFVTTPTQGGTDAYAFLPPAYRGTGWTSLQIPATTVYTAAWDETARLPQTAGWDANDGDGRTVIVDYSRYYHSSGDTPENTTEREPQNLVRAARLAALTLIQLARTDATPSAR